MSAPDCTCVPLYQTIDGGVSIHWIVAHCPLHAAAKRVYEALSKAYRQYNDPCGKCWGGLDGEYGSFHILSRPETERPCPCSCHEDDDWDKDAALALAAARGELTLEDLEAER